MKSHTQTSYKSLVLQFQLISSTALPYMWLGRGKKKHKLQQKLSLLTPASTKLSLLIPASTKLYNLTQNEEL